MRARAPAWIGVIFLLAIPAAANPALDDARRSFDRAELGEVVANLVRHADVHPDDFESQRDAAEGYLLQATALRNDRSIRALASDEVDAHRDEQKRLGDAGLPHAEAALALAASDAERADAERLIGELYTHRIRGFLSGMLNGPRARTHVERALELAPDDPECRRAIALMYLHNPPISGGDVPRAVETFAVLSDEVPDSDVYPVLLAMAHRKAGDVVRARMSALRALAINPDNDDAKALILALE